MLQGRILGRHRQVGQPALVAQGAAQQRYAVGLGKGAQFKDLRAGG